MNSNQTICLNQAARMAVDPQASEAARTWARGMIYSVRAHVAPLLDATQSRRLDVWLSAVIDASKAAG